MDNTVSDKLCQFIDQILGDNVEMQSSATNNKGKSKKKKKRKSVSQSEEETKLDNLPQTGMEQKQMSESEEQKEVAIEPDVTPKEGTKFKKTKSKMVVGCPKEDSLSADKKERFTEDGFKITSSIPDDDSDISDAFEYDSDDETFGHCQESKSAKGKNNTKGTKAPPKMTEDGFNIVTDIPPDDSDVSDAFDEEDEGLGSEQETRLKGHQERSHKNVKRPILQMLDDFGIGNDILLGKPRKSEDTITLKPRSKGESMSTLTLAAKKKKQKEVMILDYSQKRGSGKKKQKTNPEPKDEEPLPTPSQATMDEKELKRVRYDVFKLGMSGFNKKLKEDTRVALAVKLGAKPPKNKAISYKVLLAMKKEEKKKETEEREQQQQLGLKVSKHKPVKPWEKNKHGSIRASSSQIGRYRNGVQVLSKRDIAKINRT